MPKLIDMDELLDKLLTIQEEYDTNRLHDRAVYAAYSECIRAIRKSSIVDTKPIRNGRWNRRDVSFADSRCSLCFGTGYYTYIFCPHCGSKMDLEVNNVE